MPDLHFGHADAAIAQEPNSSSTVGTTAHVSDAEMTVQQLIISRRHTSPRRLTEPGPTAEQIEFLFTLCAAAPDHGLLVPWRFVIIPFAARRRLGEVFALSLVDRHSDATQKQIEAARDKAYRAPFLTVAIARLAPDDPDIPALERMISMGAAIQNILIGAQALGLGSGLTSGRAMSSPHMRSLLALEAGEEAVCCINIGSVAYVKERMHPRPTTEDFVSHLSDNAEKFRAQ